MCIVFFMVPLYQSINNEVVPLLSPMGVGTLLNHIISMLVLPYACVVVSILYGIKIKISFFFSTSLSSSDDFQQ